MAKPILIIKMQYNSAADYEKCEYLNVKLQQKMEDYHVLAVPVERYPYDGMEFQVYNAPDAHETNIFEIKEMILNELRNGKIK